MRVKGARVWAKLAISLYAVFGCADGNRLMGPAESMMAASSLPQAQQQLAEPDFHASDYTLGLPAPTGSHDLRSCLDESGIRIHVPTTPEFVRIYLATVTRGEALDSIDPDEVIDDGEGDRRRVRV